MFNTKSSAEGLWRRAKETDVWESCDCVRLSNLFEGKTSWNGPWNWLLPAFEYHFQVFTVLLPYYFFFYIICQICQKAVRESNKRNLNKLVIFFLLVGSPCIRTKRNYIRDKMKFGNNLLISMFCVFPAPYSYQR